MIITPAILINETEISPVEYENQRVVTFAMVDKVHGRKTGTAQRNFIANKERLIEKEDYYLVGFSQNNVFRCFGIQIPPRGLTVLTESGYLLLVKSFTDDLAWQVQRQLVRSYFKAKPAKATHSEPDQLTNEERSAIMDDIYNSIGQIRESADNLVCFYREMHKSLNKIGNMISILNAVDYKESRIRELKVGR